MVQQERERLLIDPTSLRARSVFGWDYAVQAVGRDDFEGETFSHVRNFGNLKETSDYVAKLNQFEKGIFVVGPGVDREKSTKRRGAMFNHTVLGVWTQIVFPKAELEELRQITGRSLR